MVSDLASDQKRHGTFGRAYAEYLASLLTSVTYKDGVHLAANIATNASAGRTAKNRFEHATEGSHTFHGLFQGGNVTITLASLFYFSRLRSAACTLGTQAEKTSHSWHALSLIGKRHAQRLYGCSQGFFSNSLPYFVHTKGRLIGSKSRKDFFFPAYGGVVYILRRWPGGLRVLIGAHLPGHLSPPPRRAQVISLHDGLAG